MTVFFWLFSKVNGTLTISSSFSKCWKMETLVPWKEDATVDDVGLWSTLSIAPKVTRPGFIE